MVDNVIYTVTSSCNDVPPAVWAIDLNVDPPRVASLPLLEAGGLTDPVIGTDGIVYVQEGRGTSSMFLGLSPRELKVKQSFGATARNPREDSKPSPLVFPYKDRDLIVTSDGSAVYLLDSASLGGAAVARLFTAHRRLQTLRVWLLGRTLTARVGFSRLYGGRMGLRPTAPSPRSRSRSRTVKQC